MAGRHLIGRIVVFAVNFALWGSGILLIVFGSIGVSSDDAAIKMLTGVSGVEYVTELLNVVPYLQGVGIFMIVLGCFLFLLGGNGCHGIMRKSRKSTMMYFIWLLCAILVELALIIYAGVYPTTTQSSIERDLTKSLNQSYASLNVSENTIEYSGNLRTASWQKLEFSSKCCGANGAKDYTTDILNPSWSPYIYNINGADRTLSFPLTCCKVTSKKYPPQSISDLDSKCWSTSPEGSFNTGGCGKEVNDMVYQFNLIAIIISSCLIGAEIVGVIFAARIWKDTDE